MEIQGPLQPFASNREYFISCKVWGSNPPARIEWFRGTSPNHGLRPLKAHNQTVLENGNVTVSWIQYLPKPSHHHQTLICRGSNDELMTAASQTVEDYHRMEIFCKLSSMQFAVFCTWELSGGRRPPLFVSRARELGGLFKNEVEMVFLMLLLATWGLHYAVA